LAEETLVVSRVGSQDAEFLPDGFHLIPFFIIALGSLQRVLQS